MRPKPIFNINIYLTLGCSFVLNGVFVSKGKRGVKRHEKDADFSNNTMEVAILSTHIVNLLEQRPPVSDISPTEINCVCDGDEGNITRVIAVISDTLLFLRGGGNHDFVPPTCHHLTH